MHGVSTDVISTEVSTRGVGGMGWPYLHASSPMGLRMKPDSPSTVPACACPSMSVSMRWLIRLSLISPNARIMHWDCTICVLSACSG